MDDEFSRYEVYTTAGSVYCYRDSGVLKNRFGLRDGAKLKLVETDLTAIRQNDLLLHPIEGRFSARQLCRIHQVSLWRHLFFCRALQAGGYHEGDNPVFVLERDSTQIESAAVEAPGRKLSGRLLL